MSQTNEGDQAATRVCPVRGCKNRCGVNKVCCKMHWFQLPQARRDEIWRLHREVPGSAAHRRAVVQALHWLSGASEHQGPPPTPPQVVHWIENVLRKRLMSDPKLLEEHVTMLWVGYQKGHAQGTPQAEAFKESLKRVVASVVMQVAGIDPEGGRDTSQQRN